MTHPLRVVVMGYIVRCPIGGMAWHHLQYFMGLSELGHDVLFIEDSGDEPWACYDPRRGVTDPDPTYGLAFARSTFERVGLGRRWAYHDALTSRWRGPAAALVPDFCRSASIVLNLSGANPLRQWVSEIPARVYIDTDPVFTQLRHLCEPTRRRRAQGHTAFFTFGENIGGSRHSIPDDAFPWRPTRQPVVLRAWPLTAGPEQGRFTTVMQWDNTLQAVPREFAGRRYGRKADTFGTYDKLPGASGAALEIALGGRDAPRDELRGKGWKLVDPLVVTKDPWRYQEYIRASRGEFSVAKDGYVTSRSGWFSERSAAYLASGRPVVIQDTGFTDWLPAGEGVVPFGCFETAVAGLRDVEERYRLHCGAARAVAETYFDAGVILPRLLDESLAFGCT